MDLSGKRIAIMIDQQYQELEVWYPLYRFREAGGEVVCVAPEAGKEYPSKLGYPCRANVSAHEVNGQDFDAVIIPGGWCPDFMRRDNGMLTFIQQCVDADIILGAICHGGWMLCGTKAFSGKRATSFMAIRHDIINAGADWVDEECVVDGKLITARKPDDLPRFCQAIMLALCGVEK